ncbi:MAG: helix-turn-helix transcriptional regulator [Lentisphaeria bacterium]|nr:helix-turn-helix transcriptional regulator [Lentisphaeria bacterium]
MEQSSAKASGVYHRISFFSDEFPFSIHREFDRPSDFNESKRFRREFWKIVYVIGGRGEEIVNETRYPVGPGTIFLVHPEDSTTFRIESEALEIYNILFMPELVRDGVCELQDDFDFFSIMHWNGRKEKEETGLYIAESDPEIRRIIRTLEREFDRMPQNYRARIRLLLLELLILLARKAGKRLRNRGPGAVRQYVDHLIESYFREEFKLGFLAERTGIDKSRLCRLYRAGAGMTIMDALRLRRLNEAAEQLTCTNRTVSEICFGSGFNDLSYFYRTFTAKFGMNPGEFRRRFVKEAEE